MTQTTQIKHVFNTLKGYQNEIKSSTPGLVLNYLDEWIYQDQF